MGLVRAGFYVVGGLIIYEFGGFSESKKWESVVPFPTGEDGKGGRVSMIPVYEWPGKGQITYDEAVKLVDNDPNDKRLKTNLKLLENGNVAVIKVPIHKGPVDRIMNKYINGTPDFNKAIERNASGFINLSDSGMKPAAFGLAAARQSDHVQSADAYRQAMSVGDKVGAVFNGEQITYNPSPSTPLPDTDITGWLKKNAQWLGPVAGLLIAFLGDNPAAYVAGGGLALAGLFAEQIVNGFKETRTPGSTLPGGPPKPEIPVIARANEAGKGGDAVAQAKEAADKALGSSVTKLQVSNATTTLGVPTGGSVAQAPAGGTTQTL